MRFSLLATKCLLIMTSILVFLTQSYRLEEIHSRMSLEQHEGEKTMTECRFLGELSLQILRETYLKMLLQVRG